MKLTLTLTTSQRMALLDVLVGHLAAPGSVEVFIDCSTSPATETTIEQLLALVQGAQLAADPAPGPRGSYDEALSITRKQEVELLGAARKYGQGTRTPTYGRREARLDRELTTEVLHAAKGYVAAVRWLAEEHHKIGESCGARATSSEAGAECVLAKGHKGPHEFPPIGGVR